MKRWICVLLALMLLPLYAVAEGDSEKGDTGSWSQINQSLSRKDNWVRFAQGDEFRLGDITPLEGSENLFISTWGTYPSIDGSTVCVPMAMELARQWLDLPEEDLNGFVNFSTTPYAYDRLIKGSANPLVTIKSRGVMMDDTHPVDLVLATYPNADERKAAKDAGVELVYVPFCCDAFIFMVNAENPVNSLTVRQIQEIYSGKISSWAQVSGTENSIEAYQRPHGSGSQTAMEEMVMNGISMRAAEANYISDGMIDAVQQIGNYNNGYNAIGYSYLYYVDTLVDDGGIKVLAVDGFKPTPKNLQSGAYPFTVNYYAVYRKGDAQTEAFVAWLTGDEGQKAVAAAGYVPLRSTAVDAEEEEDDEDEYEGEYESDEDDEEDLEYIRAGNGELTISEGTVTLGIYEGEPNDEDPYDVKTDPEIQALFDGNTGTVFYGDYASVENEDRDTVSGVNWPSSVRFIGAQAFQGINFNSFILPASLERIYPNAFNNCSFGTLRIECALPYEQIEYLTAGENKIGGFDVPENHPLFTAVDGVLYSKDGKTLLKYPNLRKNMHFTVPADVEHIADGAFCNDHLLSVSLPESIKTIGRNAFRACKNLTAVGLSDGVESIGDGAFRECEMLESIQFPAGLKAIGNSAFGMCKKLPSIELPDGLETIGSWAFSGCDNMKTVQFPDSVTAIGNNAFNYSGLISVTIPEKVTVIEPGSFMSCHDLEEINLHDGIRSIGYSAFSGCKKVTSLTIPDSVQIIEDSAFQDLGITSLTISGNIQVIGDSAFSLCTELKNVTLLNGITSIGNKAFSSCYKLTSITIPKSVTNLGDEVFANCESLTNIAIPESVTNLGNKVFAYCDRLLYAVIPDSVTGIGENLFLRCRRDPCCYVTEGSYAMQYCEKNGIKYRTANLTEGAEIEKPEFPYRSGDFRYVILSDGTAAIVKADTGTECVIPRELDGYVITAIGLQNDSQWQEIYIDLGLIDTDKVIYHGVVNPECVSIEIPDTVKTIGIIALYGCRNLETVSLPASLETIGHQAFLDSGITSVKIPEHVTYIGNYAFSNCSQLTEAVLPGSVEKLYDGMFDSCTSLKEVTVSEGVQTINPGVFSGCPALRKVKLPKSVKKINKSAFLLCDNLSCVVLDGSYAQKYCEKYGIPYTVNE